MNDQMVQIEKLTRDAIKEVFDTMLSMEINPETPPGPLALDPLGQVVGSVGFIGEATGIIYLYIGVGFARVIASRMLGISETDVDTGEGVTDAIGELSNMVVGQVKSHLCNSGLLCTLTIPSVVRGQHLTVEGSSHCMRSTISFRNCTHQLLAEVMLKETAKK